MSMYNLIEYSNDYLKTSGNLWQYCRNELIFASTIAGCFSISAFASLLAIPIEITSFVIGLKMCTKTAGIKNFKSILKKKKKKHDKIALLAKSKLNAIWALISKSVIDSNNTSHDEFYIYIYIYIYYIILY